MRRPRIVDFNRRLLKHIFNWRFGIAEITKKSETYKKVIDFTLFKDDEIVVIPNTINVNKKIESEGSEFLPTDIIKEVIKRSSYIFIMNSCLCRTSNGCKDYPKDIGCIFLGPTASKIPKHLGKRATVKEAFAQVDRADAAGLSHIIGRNKIDTLWMNVHPGKGLLTICHCCPCCCLWKVYPNLNTDISDKLEKLDGISVKLHQDKCTKCRKCLKNCMFKAIRFKNKKITINHNICRGCGLCVNACEYDAITIEYSEKTIDKIVDRMENLVEIKKL